MSVCKSFKEQVCEKSRVLILGSMPGVKSLDMAEYYAHPNNRFWKVLGVLTEKPDLYLIKYEDKIQTLLNSGYALWDVIGICKRNGSLDSNIKDIRPNKIGMLLNKYPKIHTIALNGGKAESAFKKYFKEIYNCKNIIRLPSTSPANARFKMDDLLKEWKIIQLKR